MWCTNTWPLTCTNAWQSDLNVVYHLNGWQAVRPFAWSISWECDVWTVCEVWTVCVCVWTVCVCEVQTVSLCEVSALGEWVCQREWVSVHEHTRHVQPCFEPLHLYVKDLFSVCHCQSVLWLCQTLSWYHTTWKVIPQIYNRFCLWNTTLRGKLFHWFITSSASKKII